MYESETSEGYADDPDSILLGDDVKAAILLLIGHWYEHRETVVVGQTAIEAPFAVESLFTTIPNIWTVGGQYGL